MLRLGHTVDKIRNVFLSYFSIVFLLMSIISLITFYILAQVIENKLVASGIILEPGVSAYSILALCIVFITFVGAIFYNANCANKGSFLNLMVKELLKGIKK